MKRKLPSEEPYITSTGRPDITMRHQSLSNGSPVVATTDIAGDFRVNHEMVHETASFTHNLRSIEMSYGRLDAKPAVLAGLVSQTYSSSLREPFSFRFKIVRPAEPKNR